MKKYLIIPLIASVTLIACKKEDENNMTNNQSDTKTFKVTIENMSKEQPFFASGVFNTPKGASAPAPVIPGESYEFSFHAGPGSKLSFATMFVQSNDLFYAPDGQGIDLYSGNTPVTGDITSQIMLWDAGTEVNEEPGTGANQAPRQSGADTGPAENGTVREISMVSDGYTYPAVNEVVKVTISNTGTLFTVTIENISSTASVPTPLAPGVWVIHTTADPLFTSGQADFGQGLEAIAEDGDPTMLASHLTDNSGLVSPLAPGIWAVHDQGIMPLFQNGVKDPGEGMEALAEDGDPSGLASTVLGKTGVKSSAVFNTPAGASAPGPLLPGSSYEFTITANKGEYLSFATMLVQSNDLFYAPSDMGLALWNTDGTVVSGDVTSKVMLWDAGTEVNEYPGAGLNQAPRQSGPNTGTDENGTIREISYVNDGFTYPGVSDVIKVTITPQ